MFNYKEGINKWINSLHVPSEVIEILEYIYDNQEKPGDKTLNISFNNKMLLVPRVAEKMAQLFITQEGKHLLKDYHQFSLLGMLVKFTKIFNKNFIAITTILALIISVIALL